MRHEPSGTGERDDEPASLSSASVGPDTPALHAHIAREIAHAGGWIGFDTFMSLALYTPGLGYYARGGHVIGAWPASGSDFITAPELTPLFGRALARQVGEALAQTGTTDLYEFGAGSGALAQQLLEALGDAVSTYWIVDVSAGLRERQRDRLARHGARVQWLSAWPQTLNGVVVGNEVLDAMPVQLLRWDGRQWFERGVVASATGWSYADRPTALRPPDSVDVDTPWVAGTTIEMHVQAEAFLASLGERLQRGAAFFIDYGFPAAEYYLPQRRGGTLMCHRAHTADDDALVDVGLKDITAHVDFTGIALAGQSAGLEVLGYTSQAHFLLNCGLLELLGADDASAITAAHARQRAAVNLLVAEHEMGELFKVIGFVRGAAFDAVGFSAGDRTHRL